MEWIAGGLAISAFSVIGGYYAVTSESQRDKHALAWRWVKAKGRKTLRDFNEYNNSVHPFVRDVRGLKVNQEGEVLPLSDGDNALVEFVSWLDNKDELHTSFSDLGWWNQGETAWMEIEVDWKDSLGNLYTVSYDSREQGVLQFPPYPYEGMVVADSVIMKAMLFDKQGQNGMDVTETIIRHAGPKHNFYADLHPDGVDPKKIFWGTMQPCHTTLMILDAGLQPHCFNVLIDRLKIHPVKKKNKYIS